MFSKELMTFLMSYGEEEKTEKEETVKEIAFKDSLFAKPVYVTVTVKK